jgi:hypothetical protein
MTPIRIVAVALAGAFLTACAAGGSTSTRQAQTASERANERWQAVIAGDHARAYDYLSPGMRSAKSREDYVAEAVIKPVRYLAAKPFAESCETDACTVNLELEYEVVIPLAGAGKQRLPAYLDERWIRLDGRWYLLPDEVP